MIVDCNGSDRQLHRRVNKLAFKKLQQTDFSINGTTDGGVVQISARRCQLCLSTLELGCSFVSGMASPTQIKLTHHLLCIEFFFSL